MRWPAERTKSRKLKFISVFYFQISTFRFFTHVLQPPPFCPILEPLQGAGLGGSALGLHLEMLRQHHASQLVATRVKDFSHEWPEGDPGHTARAGEDFLFAACIATRAGVGFRQ